MSLLPSLILTFATLISAAHAQAADCSTPWRGGSIARMFAAPFNVFANNAPLLTLNCTQNAYKITVGDNSSTLYIYKDAYLTTDGDTFTQNVPLTPDSTQQIGDWIIGRATATIPYFTSTAPTNYLAFYSCVKTAAGFQCGCSSRTRCSTPDTGNFIWHLGGFKTQTPQTQGVVTEGATATTAAAATTVARGATGTQNNATAAATRTARGGVTVASAPQSSAQAVPVSLPACTGSATLIIDSADDWQKINDAAYTNFCVKPGDYRSAGVITLTSSGSAQAPRVIQLLNDNDTHPARLPDNQQAFLGGLRLGNGGTPAHYWIVDRISLVGLQENGMVGINEGSSDNVLNRLVMRNNGTGIDLQHGANRNAIQNSYIGDMTEAAVQGDIVCIGLQSYQGSAVIADTRIVGNELVNCNDAIQFIRNGSNPSGSFPGTLVADNDIYMTADRLTDCNGTVNGTGPCMIGENAIDAKGGSDDASKPIRIIGNRMWNIRRSDPVRKPGGSWGDAMVVQYNTQNMIIKDNVIMDSNRGIVIHLGTHDTITEGNTLVNIGAATEGAGYGIIITSEAGGNNVVRGNTIINADKPLQDAAGGNRVENNTVGDGGDGEMCFTVKRISDPQQKCVPVPAANR